MSLTIAALFYRPSEISERTLSLGFAVALAGWEVPAPRLVVGPLAGSDYWVAFYSSGADGDDATDHAIELFEEELSPLVAVLDVAEMTGGSATAKVFGLVYTDDFLYDDGWYFGPDGVERHFVRDGEGGLEAGVETHDDVQLETVQLEIPDGATEGEEQALEDAAVRPHRGSIFLESALGKGVLQRVVRASFEADKRVMIRLVEPSALSIEAETRKLVAVLKREAGRGAIALPKTKGGVAPPSAVTAFAAAYDWVDPADPGDLYRELSIGAIQGNVRFLRAVDIGGFEAEPKWKSSKGEALYPIAKVVPSALGGRSEAAFIAVAPDGEKLYHLRPGQSAKPAGPTLGEFLLYLALGWTKRSPAEEELIGALMLQAQLRTETSPLN